MASNRRYVYYPDPYDIEAGPVEKAEEEEKEGNRVCTVCWINAPVMTAEPCGHTNYCGPCAARQNAKRAPCVICRAPVTQYVRAAK